MCVCLLSLAQGGGGWWHFFSASVRLYTPLSLSVCLCLALCIFFFLFVCSLFKRSLISPPTPSRWLFFALSSCTFPRRGSHTVTFDNASNGTGADAHTKGLRTWSPMLVANPLFSHTALTGCNALPQDPQGGHRPKPEEQGS